MTGFEVKDGIAFKVEIPDNDNTVTENVVDDAEVGSAYVVTTTCEKLMEAKKTLSDILVSMSDDIVASYEKLHQKPSPYDPPGVKAMTYDMLSMYNRYNDYYHGMVSYVKLICDINPGELNETEVEEKINRAISNDPGFITSLNDYEDMDLSRCITQIEVVVNILEDIGDKATELNKIFASAKDNHFTALAEKLICGSLQGYARLMVTSARSNADALNRIITAKKIGYVPKPDAPKEIPTNAFKML